MEWKASDQNGNIPAYGIDSNEKLTDYAEKGCVMNLTTWPLTG